MMLAVLNKTSGTEWTIMEVSMIRPKPATSCHFTYKPKCHFKGQLIKSWELECSAVVEQTTDCTYFCLLGWREPGGYCGVQQLPKGVGKAIYSLWNCPGNQVKCLEAGEGVKVTGFDGEGTGLKSMRDFDWKVGQKVTFKVKGDFADGTWTCTCNFKTDGLDWQLMTSFQRSGGKFHPETGFYSFVEDWNRVCGAEGHKVKRKARFFNQRMVINGEDVELEDSPKFTKVQRGSDKFACHKATHSCTGDKEWILETGGSCEEDNI